MNIALHTIHQVQGLEAQELVGLVMEKVGYQITHVCPAMVAQKPNGVLNVIKPFL